MTTILDFEARMEALIKFYIDGQDKQGGKNNEGARQGSQLETCLETRGQNVNLHSLNHSAESSSPRVCKELQKLLFKRKKK